VPLLPEPVELPPMLLPVEPAPVEPLLPVLGLLLLGELLVLPLLLLEPLGELLVLPLLEEPWALSQRCFSRPVSVAQSVLLALGVELELPVDGLLLEPLTPVPDEDDCAKDAADSENSAAAVAVARSFNVIVFSCGGGWGGEIRPGRTQAPCRQPGVSRGPRHRKARARATIPGCRPR
jgi:hypothetical protein